MVPHLGRAVAHVKARLHGSLGVDVDALATQSGHRWRRRTLTPGVTVWIFFLQILNGNLAMSGLARLHPAGFAASSYCKARMRLPIALFTRLFDTVSRAAGAIGEQCQDSLLNGRRVLLADGTTFSVPDTPKLRRKFGYPSGQRPGIGFPMSRLLGVIDAMTGTLLLAMGCPLFTHEARESLALHSLLKRGDVLVADRGFCSYLEHRDLLQSTQDAREDERAEEPDRRGNHQGTDHVPDRLEPGADDDGTLRPTRQGQRLAGELPRRGAMPVRDHAAAGGEGGETAD
jgi:DDE family transposase